jgi:hypothetical protein
LVAYQEIKEVRDEPGLDFAWKGRKFWRSRQRPKTRRQETTLAWQVSNVMARLFAQNALTAISKFQ